MKNKILIIFLIIVFGLQNPGFARCKKNQPAINPNEKIGYVNLNWWDNFSDPCLKYYITQAIINNHDARRASWQVEEYKQMVKVQFAQELPSLSMGVDYAGVHLPDAVIKDFNKNILTVPFTASYEADIFRKNHDKTKSSKKACEASKYQEQSLYISLVSDVASVYINILKFDELISLQKDILCTKKEILAREEARYKRGLTTAQKINKLKNDYVTSQNTMSDYIKSRDKLLTQLAVLTGDSAYNIACIKRGNLNDLDYKVKIPTDIPSNVLFSRPDILAAEANLQKAKIDVQVARKEFLPTINITGFYALSTLGGANFFSWQSAIAAVLAGATQDLYTGGRKTANLKISKIKYESVFDSYKQTDLNAIKEVKDSLLMIDEDTRIDENTISKSNIQLDTFNRSCSSFKRGVVPVQSVLTEKEQLLNLMQNRVSSKSIRLVDYITLYKAVGGAL